MGSKISTDTFSGLVDLTVDLTLVRTRRPRPRPPGAAPARTLGCLLGVMMAAMLTGCGNSGPTADPAASPTHTVTADPSGPPSLPAAARKHTKAGAIAFVRHYIDLINYAQRTNDVSAVRAASLSDCESCNSTNRYLVKLAKTGGKIKGGRTVVKQILDADSPTAYGDYAVHLAITIKPSTEIRGDGTRRKYKGGNNLLSVFPKWSDGNWKVAQWTRAK